MRAFTDNYRALILAGEHPAGGARMIARGAATCVGVLFFACGTLHAHAAQIYLDPVSKEHSRADTFYVPVRIDTQGECINAVSVAIAYDPEHLSVRDVTTGESILTLWTRAPEVLREGSRETGRVVFEGGVPGGYCGRVLGDPGRTDTLATLVVTGSLAQQENAEVSITPMVLEPGSVVYLNDGSGKPAERTLLGVEFTMRQASGTPANTWYEDVQADTVAPEYFEITLVEGPSEGNLRHFIAFNTVDKQSGLDHYEILETDPDRYGWLTFVPREAHWVRGASPYVLRDQGLTSKIMVKAVDKAGNERIAWYTPPMSPFAELARPGILIPVVLLLVCGLGIAIMTARTMRKRARRTSDEQPVPYEN